MAEDNIVDLNDYRMKEEPPKLTLDASQLKQQDKITFSTDEGECGSLIMVDGQLTFEGNADASAMVFFDYLMQLWNKDSTN